MNIDTMAKAMAAVYWLDADINIPKAQYVADNWHLFRKDAAALLKEESTQSRIRRLEFVDLRPDPWVYINLLKRLVAKEVARAKGN